MMTWESWYLMDSKSPVMEQLTIFHEHIMMILITIMTTISSIMVTILSNKLINKTIYKNQTIEVIWTTLPSLALLMIASPSMNILYLTDEMNNPSISMKTIAHQWYWTYEFSDFLIKEIESFMTPIKNLKTFNFRLLDVDNQLTLPFKSKIRMIFSSTDVIHSWTIQSLGTKMDATPGRTSQNMFFLSQSGIYFGQCSEICGMNHSFMPTSIESVTPQSFIKWIKS